MKPPAILNNLNSHDDVGPIYHIQPTELDWSAWHPLHPNPISIDPSISSTNLNENYSHSPSVQFTAPGTPVETYPAVLEDEEDVTKPELNVVTEVESVTLEPLLDDVQNQTEIIPDEQEEQTTVVVVNNNKTSASPADEKPVKIRICRPSNSTENGTNEIEGRKMLDCVEPLDEPSVHFEPEDHKVGEAVPGESNTLKEFGSDVPPDNPELRNEILNSIPVPPQSFWNAMQHNATPTDAIHHHHQHPSQYEGADPDVVLPPHLQYTLQQLDSQGFGPKSSHIAYRNSFFSHKNRGLIPSSRALKPRPVMLSSRRQAKVMNNNGPVPGGPTNLPGNIGPHVVGPILANGPVEGRYNSQQQQQHQHQHIHGPHFAMHAHPPLQSVGQNLLMNPHSYPPADSQRVYPRRLAGHPPPPPAYPPPVLNPLPSHSRSGQQSSMIPLASNQQVIKSAPPLPPPLPPNSGPIPGPGKNIGPSPQSSYVTKHKGYYIVPYYFERNPGGNNNGMLFSRRVFPHRRPTSQEPVALVPAPPQAGHPPPPSHAINIVGNKPQQQQPPSPQQHHQQQHQLQQPSGNPQIVAQSNTNKVLHGPSATEGISNVAPSGLLMGHS